MYLKEKMQGRVFQTVNVTSYDDDTEVDFIYNNPHCKQPESCSKSLSHKCICPSDIDDKLEAAFLNNASGLVVYNNKEDGLQKMTLRNKYRK